ncbi:related to Dcl-2 dicer RNA helicase/RNAseIII CAF [Phialocephala subalpina]|uniref:Related to Dcl-2 dicer RNA helicase/RNAseIII CAF n=1 Tax=Phialocephala subalpina TaxID=576137 RepID=A0A1L7WJS0_9HELO|nr:related to Dcl-2 dicer RNA helicase/RNAseIII CAF [Phialocephala subalpina]
MDDSDDSSSESSDTILDLHQDNSGEIPFTTPLAEDLTDEDKFLSDESSLTSLVLKDDEPPKIKPRPFQREMFEESLRRNIIVAMDTGSGKTHIAVMRMLHELENIPSNQIIWFLAPTVYLCSQQFDYIQSQISAVEVKFLSGADGVDHWSTQSHWDAVLLNVKVVVSTYQILLDALSHDFVQMASLALIVFDEAHNCVDKYPGAMLMRNFYWPRKRKGLNVPHILGLTASPVMRSSTSSLTTIEKTLDAICRTPSKHRAELRLQVKLPALSQVYYKACAAEGSVGALPRTMTTLAEAYNNRNLQEDPEYLTILKDNTKRGREKLDKVRMSGKTPCADQLKSFTGTAQKIWEDLGTWSAEYYIAEVVLKVLSDARKSDNSLGIWDISGAEKQYLAKALRGVELNPGYIHGPILSSQTTDKVEKMLDVLLQSAGEHFSGIIFVQERAVARVLAKLISIHPKTRHRFDVGFMVGTSTYNRRSGKMGELINLDEQKNTLAMFKKGKINLVIATSVLEEGIDVPACNLVLCSQKPANLKSFIQRRGRARHHDSRLVLLLSEGDKVEQWQQMEDDMKAIYENEMRTLQEQLVKEDAEEHDGRTFTVPTTSALLDLDNAVRHLYYFCATLPSNEYVDLRPDFECIQVAGGLTTASVTLPISVHEAVRTAKGKNAWQSEKNAIKDAAFEAYIALYRVGLVNDNLLPLLRHDAIIDELRTSAVETRASIVSVHEQMNPWIELAHAWIDILGPEGAGNICQATITVGDLELELFLPAPIFHATFHVYWDLETELLVSIIPKPTFVTLPIEDSIGRLPGDTMALLQAAFGARFPVDQWKTLPIQFVSHIEKPLQELLGRDDTINAYDSLSGALIRDKFDPNVVYTFRELLQSKPDIESVQYPYQGYQDAPKDSAHLSLNRVPRRNDFLHQVVHDTNAKSTTKQFAHVLPLARCTVDELPFKLVQFGRLIPSIMHRLETVFIAQELSRTILHEVQISNLSLILTAISASVAREDSNYQRLEFLGDSVLKTCASIQLIGEYPLWHEGYLSGKKDRLVSNSRLSRAAMEIGLDRFILTKPFTGNKWRPQYVQDLVALPIVDLKRDMSTKVLADVVEALIGAATVDGGIPKALACMQTFLHELEWKPLEERRMFLHSRTPEVELPATLQPLETLIGYSFTRKALLIEAMTHASCNSGSGSLERFEFLGDSILDNIIVTAMWETDLSHYQMHLLRTALVNADFLAFICMEWSIQHETIDLDVECANKQKAHISENYKTVSWALWRFMRHMSPKLGFEQAVTAARHAELRTEVKHAIEHGSHYPWALLSRLRAHKYYSDIIESLLGAVWIDSGSFDVCREIVTRMGIIPYLDRILKDGVHVLHPKEELGMLADDQKVKYVMEKVQIDKEDADDVVAEEQQERQSVCTVFVGEKCVVSLTANIGKDVLRTMAAEKAVEILKAREKGIDDEEMEIERLEKENIINDTHMADDW